MHLIGKHTIKKIVSSTVFINTRNRPQKTETSLGRLTSCKEKYIHSSDNATPHAYTSNTNYRLTKSLKNGPLSH